MPFFCNNCGIKLSKKTISGLCHKCLVNKNRNDLINNWLKTGDTNCDSQLPTYKSRNKHSARDYRRLGCYERERFSASKVVCRKMENRVPFR